MSRPVATTARPRVLDQGRQLAAVAGVVFLVAFLLPWYQKSVLNPSTNQFVSDGINAFGAFGWVQAALLLVDGAVLTLLWLRGQGRRVELPGSDGTVIAFAGAWMVVLLIVCVLDKPDVTGLGATIGVQWGLLVAMAAAGAMFAAGLLGRAIERGLASPIVDPTAPTAVDGFTAQVPPRWRRPAGR